VMERAAAIIAAAEKVTPGKVFWKETSPQQGQTHGPLDIDNKVAGICAGGACTYIRFPEFPPRLMDNGQLRRWDGMHFADLPTYR